MLKMKNIKLEKENSQYNIQLFDSWHILNQLFQKLLHMKMISNN